MKPNQRSKTAVDQQRLVTFLIAGITALSLSGCDHSTPQERDLFAKKNPTHTWNTSTYAEVTSRQFPKIVLHDTVVDFGLVEPKTGARQVIDVRNEGKAPLLLKLLDDNSTFTIDCTPIPPGEERQLTLIWTPPSFFENYQGTVRLQTNDPSQPTRTLAVTGQALYAIAVDPPVLLAKRMRPNQPHKTEVVISSQRWDTFSLEDIKTDLTGLDFELTPAGEDVLGSLNAKSGWLLKIALPSGLASGVIDQSINLRVNPSLAGAKSRPLKIPIRGRVLRRIAVYGKGIDSNGTISFGVVPSGREHMRRLIVKVHDNDPHLSVRDLQITPSFVTARLLPYGRESGIDNLYHLLISLPATAPETICRGEQLGMIRFEFDHPRIKELVLNLDFILHDRMRHKYVSFNEHAIIGKP